MLRRESFTKASRLVVVTTMVVLGLTVLPTAPALASSPPTVTGLSPSSGPTSGVTTVIISGSGFTGATAVSFGMSSASFVVTSDSSITARAPAQPVATVDVTVTTPDGTSATGPADQFTYTPPTVTGVRPSSGPFTGGTTVIISGSGFTGATMVAFGMTSASFVATSDRSITATAPAEAVGPVDIIVTTPEGTSSPGPADTFTYVVPPPTVTGVSPTSGPVSGGTAVTITGTGFTGATTVSFGTVSVPFTVISDTSITTTSPAESPADSPGKVDVTVTSSDGTSATGAADKFTFITPRPGVTSISPTFGPTAGGTSVTITGTGFTGATAVHFGRILSPSFTVGSDSTITARSPAESKGKVDVTVMSAGGTSPLKRADKFLFVAPPPAPIVTAVTPGTGPTAGKTTVTIKGRNFTKVTSVDFGAVSATSVVVKSKSMITASSPPEGAGKVDVTVTSAGGTSATSTEDTFTFVAPPPLPTVTDVSPTSGPTTGGTTVTITGTNLTGATSITFGSLRATSFTVVSATSATASTPADGASTVDVKVTTPGGTSASSPVDRFTFVRPPSPPTVTGLSPSSAPDTGGTTVTITGTNFSQVTAVDFGTVPAASFTVNSVTSIEAVSPVTVPGHVDVTVTTSGGTSPTGSDAFTVTPPPPTVTFVSPSSGPSSGGTIVTISGTDLTGATAVDFGSVAAPSFKVQSATTIVATSPAVPKGKVDVTVTTAGGTSVISAADKFSFSPPLPSVAGISPNVGPSTGGTAVTVTGTNFTGVTSVDFGTVAAPSFKVQSATSITATSPAQSSGTVHVTVTTAVGTSTTSLADTFTFTAPPARPKVTKVSPHEGPTSGGTSVTVAGSGFSGATGVLFGGVAASFVVTSSTSITAVSPAASAGRVDVTVTTSAGTSPTGRRDRFTYVPS